MYRPKADIGLKCASCLYATKREGERGFCLKKHTEIGTNYETCEFYLDYKTWLNS